jgi:hypothetical protein
MHLKRTLLADAGGYLWNPAEALPRGMSSQDLQAVVGAWQSGAISRDTMFELFRSGEILPDGRTNQDEEQLIRVGREMQALPGLLNAPSSRTMPQQEQRGPQQF